MAEAFIKVDRLTLSVPIYLQRERQVSSWGGMFLGAALDPPQRELVRLLDSISFEAHEGDRVAILGRNGAGKSTLLRALNGVYAPTMGSVLVAGSRQALLNMSLGFNGEATVRENIFLRGTAMGMKTAMLREQIDPILEFSGLQEKANHRLRTLSAGQKMRLGFAISTSFQHDVILMDEWVGAGDSEFMAKATERMQSRVNGSKIVMLASHSVGLLRDICNKGIVLEKGRLKFAGEIVAALHCYHELLARPQAEQTAIDAGPIEAVGAAGAAYGAVESITIESGVVYVTGWCVSAEGVPQEGLVLEVNGARYPVVGVERYRRPDVVRHLGLNNDECGFRAQFALPLIEKMSQIGPDLRMLAGESISRAHAPLRIAPVVKAVLQGGN